MDITYDVRPLDAEVESAYRRLLPEQLDLVDRGKLAWKFLRHPAAAGVVATARLDGAIVGINGFAPTRLLMAGERRLAFQSLDTVVDPVCRGKGVFPKLVQAFYAAAPGLDAAALYGIPNANSAPGFFNKDKLGWTSLGAPPFLMKPLRAGYFARRVMGEAGGLFDALPLSLVGRPGGAGRAVRIERFDARADALWQAFAADIPCAVDRTHDYLNWRLADHPTAEYETQAVFDGDTMRAFVTSHLADKHGGRIGYIMEAMALPGAEDDLVMLLKLAVAGMRAQQTDAVLAWAAPHAPCHGAYRRTGFLPMPERIRPIHLHFGGKPLVPAAERVFTAPTDWYLSYLDSDTV